MNTCSRAALWACIVPLAAHAQSVRPPAVPLITHDPYLSVWSMTDRLTGDFTRHWTKVPQPLTGLARIDGHVFRWISSEPKAIPPMTQKDLSVTPTRTTYRFEQQGVGLEISFPSPLLPSDPDLLSRPISYVTATAACTDGRRHAVQLLIEVSSILASDELGLDLVWSHSHSADMTVLRASRFEQPILQKAGDDLRIAWGYIFQAVPDQAGATAATVSQEAAEAAFIAGGRLPGDDLDMPRPARRAVVSHDRAAAALAAGKPPDTDDPDALPRPDRQAVVLASEFDLGAIGGAPVSRHLLLGYDDLYSIEYLKRWMRPYWRRNGMQIGELIETAEREYSQIDRRARAFDDRLASDLRASGGEAYAQLGTLAFRQAIAACKLVADIDGHPMLFPKENSSNGCVSTVDVIYPGSPLFLLLNPALLEAELRPLMQYTRSGQWRFPFAPHDLGRYPKANGQVYGGGELTDENQMPVEETGNMLLLFAALAKAQGRADYANQYWPELQRWAEYLHSEGMDPANQLSTDDFSGHLAHNSNLSIKAILALAG